MSWFGKRSKKKHPEKRQVPNITFVGEQDGPVEQTLKNSFVDFFRRDQSVLRAFLAQVQFAGNPQVTIALCLKTQFGEDPGLAEKVGTIFSSQFKGDQFLDIIFIDDEQQEALKKVCHPFFEKS